MFYKILKWFEVITIYIILYLLTENFYGERGFKSAMTRLHDLLWLTHQHNGLDTVKSYLDYLDSLSLAEWSHNELLLEILRITSF